MIKLDLITGFLGAGKTSFLLRYARRLMQKGEKIGILVYDHGAVNVDLPLLNELRCGRCELETLAGSCDADCHRRRFRTKLITMAMSGYDRVIIEPSGVFDMDEFFDTLQEPPLDSRYEIGSVIAVVDAGLEEATAEEEDFFLASQAAGAGCVLFSKVQCVSPETVERTLRHLERATERIHGAPIPRENILIKDWDALTEEDWDRLSNCGYRTPDYVKTIAGGSAGFQSLSYLDLPEDGAGMREKAESLLHDASFGAVLRVKGFFREEGTWYQLNATAKESSVTEVPPTRSTITVIGRALDENAVSLLLTGKLPELRHL